MTLTIWLAVAAGAMAAAAMGLPTYGKRRWADSTSTLRRRLESARKPPTVARYDAHELEGLPVPVQRYFRAVLKDGQRIVAAVSVEHSGTFNLSASGAGWKAFTSQQRVVTRSPGFLWDARMDIVPGFAVRVHDAYIAGEGMLRVALFGLFALVNLRGTSDIARGELFRFFAEAVWYPTSLLPSQGVKWEVVDSQSANATLDDGKISVKMLFVFNDTGLIESARADARGATVGKAIVMTPWQVRVSDYEERGGMLVPLDGEAAWVRFGECKPYWRGTITSLAYEFSS